MTGISRKREIAGVVDPTNESHSFKRGAVASCNLHDSLKKSSLRIALDNISWMNVPSVGPFRWWQCMFVVLILGTVTERKDGISE